jgi:hypothetical protein
MTWLPQFTAPQWVLLAWMILFVLSAPSDERLAQFMKETHPVRVGSRIAAMTFLAALLGWAGFWS